MNKHDFPTAKRLHVTPRERGKRGYRDGLTLRDNPYQDRKSKVAWSDGWIYQQVHYPTVEDAKRAKQDLDCLSPWDGDDSGYGGYD